MKVYVNQRPVELLPGMTVKHALIGTDLLKEVEGDLKVFDEWGNEVGLDGGISEGMQLIVR